LEKGRRGRRLEVGEGSAAASAAGLPRTHRRAARSLLHGGLAAPLDRSSAAPVVRLSSTAASVREESSGDGTTGKLIRLGNMVAGGALVLFGGVHCSCMEKRCMQLFIAWTEKGCGVQTN
jgi:hypothetical protein